MGRLSIEEHDMHQSVSIAVFLFVFACFPRTASSSSQLDAKALMERCFHNLYGSTTVQSIELRVDLGDSQLFREIEIARTVSKHGLNRMLIFLQRPPDLRGVRLLLRERDNGWYDALMYQPLHRRIRRISVAQRSDNFFGTAVDFEDFESKRPIQWETQFVEATTLGSHNVRVLDLVPVALPSAYDRIRAWFDEDRPVFWRAEFFRDGERWKTMEVDPMGIMKIEGLHVPTKMTIRRARGPKTHMTTKEVRVLESLPDSLFTRSKLEARRSLRSFLRRQQ